MKYLLMTFDSFSEIVFFSSFCDLASSGLFIPVYLCLKVDLLAVRQTLAVLQRLRAVHGSLECRQLVPLAVRSLDAGHADGIVNVPELRVLPGNAAANICRVPQSAFEVAGLLAVELKQAVCGLWGETIDSNERYAKKLFNYVCGYN